MFARGVLPYYSGDSSPAVGNQAEGIEETSTPPWASTRPPSVNVEWSGPQMLQKILLRNTEQIFMLSTHAFGIHVKAFRNPNVHTL